VSLVTQLRAALDRAPQPPVEGDFTSPWHDRAVAARVGTVLGVCFGVCFVTGVLSHVIQHPGGWFVWPADPAWLFRLTQGAHVLTGLLSIPLLLVKLWTVYPKLFTSPPVRSVLHGVERLSVGMLFASSLFMLVTGIQNIAHWYPWGFSFVPAHYALAWVSIGSILVHVAVKLPQIRAGLGAPVDDAGPSSALPSAGPSRRWLLVAAGAGAGAALLATAGQTVPWLRRVSVLAARTGLGPQGVPVNKTAASAGVRERAVDAGWRLTVQGPARSVSLSLAQLTAMPQHTVDLPIACVEGWSATATWQGVRVRDLAAAAGVPDEADLRFESLQQNGSYRMSVLPAWHVQAAETLIALRINGEPLDLDHGYPCRLIAPSRPGVLQTKWLSRVEVAG
jgi:DMSO/TMAO reductase YedYZ molybdopterin-dependent catalytic subunit